MTVQLRPVETGDVAVIAAFLAHPDLVDRRGLQDDRPGPRSVVSLSRAVEELVDPEEHVAAWAVVADDVVGLATVGSGWDALSPWAHLVIAPAHQRKGYGSAAARLVADHLFTSTPAVLVQYGVPDWDEDGIGFAESLGGEEVGRSRRVGIHLGRYYDQVEFAMPRARWGELSAARG